MALPLRLIKTFFWGSESGQGRSNWSDGSLHHTNHRERYRFHEGIPHLALINTGHRRQTRFCTHQMQLRGEDGDDQRPDFSECIVARSRFPSTD
jgi:hypothetical protein